MWLTDNGSGGRETPGVRIVNVAGGVGIQIVDCIIQTTDGVAPSGATNPVLGAYRRSVQAYRHFESELSVIEVVEIGDHAIGPVVESALYRFTVREAQSRPIGREPLRH